ncbi:MAG: hypothetical protein LBT16_05430 [Treponema sp.]|jgi:hypothetical protein|nr:hypothetical protein [Treponema sp.]
MTGKVNKRWKLPTARRKPAVLVPVLFNIAITGNWSGPAAPGRRNDVPPEEEQNRLVFYLNECINAGFDLCEAMGGIARALQDIFIRRRIPEDGDFHELTTEEYICAYARFPGMFSPEERLYSLSQEKTAFTMEIVTEEQISWYRKAEKVIEQYCTDLRPYSDSEERKFFWLTAVLPVEFTRQETYP